MANDPMFHGGATDVAAGEKAARLFQLCDTFHLPLVDLADEPGLMVGLASEKQGIERAGARLVCITNESRMPWITIVIRRLYGVGGQTHHRASGMFRRYAWPLATGARCTSPAAPRPPTGARSRRRRIPTPSARRSRTGLERLASPFRTAEATGQDIIDPRDTRPLLADFVADAQRILELQTRLPPVPYRP